MCVLSFQRTKRNKLRENSVSNFNIQGTTLLISQTYNLNVKEKSFVKRKGSICLPSGGMKEFDTKALQKEEIMKFKSMEIGTIFK